jgi:dTMP kinase
VHFTREPGGTPAAERIRELLLAPLLEMDPWTEVYLYAAARADNTRREILPRLARGEVIICERYLDSSVAYQGYGRELGAGAVRELNSKAVAEAVPDRTFYLRLDEVERKRRAQESGLPPDRIERVGAEFMRRVEAGFEEIAGSEPERVIALDATRSPEELAEMVRSEVLRLYTRRI